MGVGSVGEWRLHVAGACVRSDRAAVTGGVLGLHGGELVDGAVGGSSAGDDRGGSCGGDVHGVGCDELPVPVDHAVGAGSGVLVLWQWAAGHVGVGSVGEWRLHVAGACVRSDRAAVTGGVLGLHGGESVDGAVGGSSAGDDRGGSCGGDVHGVGCDELPVPVDHAVGAGSGVLVLWQWAAGHVAVGSVGEWRLHVAGACVRSDRAAVTGGGCTVHSERGSGTDGSVVGVGSGGGVDDFVVVDRGGVVRSGCAVLPVGVGWPGRGPELGRSCSTGVVLPEP